MPESRKLDKESLAFIKESFRHNFLKHALSKDGEFPKKRKIFFYFFLTVLSSVSVFPLMSSLETDMVTSTNGRLCVIILIAFIFGTMLSCLGSTWSLIRKRRSRLKALNEEFEEEFKVCEKELAQQEI